MFMMTNLFCICSDEYTFSQMLSREHHKATLCRVIVVNKSNKLFYLYCREADRRAAALAQPRRRDEGRKSELHERPVRDRDRDRDRDRERDRERERNHEPVETIGDKKKEPVVQDERPSEVVMYPIRATKAQSNPAKGRVGGTKSYREPQAPRVEVPQESTSDSETSIWAAFRHKKKVCGAVGGWVDAAVAGACRALFVWFLFSC